MSIMNDEIKTEWLSRLRSDRYEQGNGELRDSRDRFCCLGVLCDIVDPTGWETKKSGGFRHLERVAYPCESVEDAAKITPDQGTNLAAQNDTGYSFAQIADWIEKNL